MTASLMESLLLAALLCWSTGMVLARLAPGSVRALRHWLSGGAERRGWSGLARRLRPADARAACASGCTACSGSRCSTALPDAAQAVTLRAAAQRSR